MGADLQALMGWIKDIFTALGDEVVLAVVWVALLSLFLTFRR